MLAKLKKLWPLILIALLFSYGPAHSSQNSTTLPTASPYPGLTMLNDINAAFDTFQTNFSGASNPSSPKTWQWYADTSTKLLKIYDGTNWIAIGNFDSSNWVPMSNGVLNTVISSTGSSNAYVLTLSPAAASYKTGAHYPFIANFANTSTATLNVNGIGAKALTKQGSVALSSGDIPSGAVVDTVYDGTRMQIVSQLSATAAGSVTSITAGSGLAGGNITTSGTISLGTSAAGTILANITGSSAVPIGTSVSAVLDSAIGSTQGMIAYRGASSWSGLAPGNSGQVLTTQGGSSNPVWKNESLTFIQTLTASNSAGIYFLNIPSGYDQYVVRITHAIPATNSVNLTTQVSNNNGSSYISVNYAWSSSINSVAGAGASGVNANASDASFSLTGTTPMFGGSQGFSGEITYAGLSASGPGVQVWWHGSFYHDTPVDVYITGGGRQTSVGPPFNAISFGFTAGNITSGTFSLYGVMNH